MPRAAAGPARRLPALPRSTPKAPVGLGLALEAMKTFRLAGVDVPRIGLGTNRLTTAPDHVSFIREAVAAGVRHFDTAHLYTGGESERALGEALRGAPEEVLVATKGGYGGAGQG